MAPALPFVRKGRVTIRYDTSRNPGERVLQNDIDVGGAPLPGTYINEWNAAPPPHWPSVRGLLRDALDATLELERVAPAPMLLSRDAADRVFEATVSTAWGSLLAGGRDNGAVEYCLAALAECDAWEAAATPGGRYVHKGAPFFFAGIAALRCRNVDLALMLLEAGDAADEETFRRAGLPTTGVRFPGRDFLGLAPSPSGMLSVHAATIRTGVEGWLSSFASDSGLTGPRALAISELDALLFGVPELATEARYVLAYALRIAAFDTDPVLQSIRGRGGASRRRLVEWALGLLTASEGFLKRAVTPTMKRPKAIDFVSEAISRKSTGGPLDPKVVKERLIAIEKGFTGVDDCLTFWGGWKPTLDTADFPWFTRWFESGRYLRNEIAHHLDAQTAIEVRWSEVDQIARNSLFSAVWLLREFRAGRL